MMEYSRKIKEEVKAVQSEIKKTIQELTVKARKPGLKSTVCTRRKK